MMRKYAVEAGLIKGLCYHTHRRFALLAAWAWSARAARHSLAKAIDDFVIKHYAWGTEV